MGARSASQGRRPGLRKGAWTAEEDESLRRCMEKQGSVKWNLVPELASLNRCRKSCRLRWLNYLCPSIKRGKFDDDEVDLIIRLHKLLGNRWSLIAGRIPGRTANDIKNHWNTHLSKQLLVEGDVRGAFTSGHVQVIKPQPQIIPRSWRWREDGEASPGEHPREEPAVPEQPPTCNSNAACVDGVVNADNVNFNASDIDVGKAREMQTNLWFDDSFRDDELLWEGFEGVEGLHPDFNLWSDFASM